MTFVLGSRAALLLVVVGLVIWRPRGLHVAVPAVVGAVLCLALGWIGADEVKTVVSLTWNATLTLIGLMLLSAVLDKNGAFRWAAFKVARWSKGDGQRLFLGLCLLTTISTAILANDGAILLVTPMVLELGRVLALPSAATFAWLFATGFLVDALSTPLATSNLTNILLADALAIAPVAWLREMLVPTLVMLPVAIATTAWMVRRDLPRRCELTPLESAPPGPRFRKRSRVASAIAIGAFLWLCLSGHAVRLPLGAGVLLIALLLVGFETLIGSVEPVPIVKHMSWGIVLFSSALFLVVMAAAKAGLGATLTTTVIAVDEVRGGLLVGGASAVFNNLPVLLLTVLGLRDAHGYAPNVPYAALLGANVGSKLFPMGSLATLLWIDLLQRGGVKVSWPRYVWLAALPTIATLLAGLIALRVL